MIWRKVFVKTSVYTEKGIDLANHFGFSLIEVLISLLLLSCILIGFDAFCMHSLKAMRNSFYFTQAVNQMSSMQERLHALGEQFGLMEQVSMWNLENSRVLPKGIGEVTGMYPEYTLIIYWGKSQSECESTTIGESGCIKENFTA